MPRDDAQGWPLAVLLDAGVLIGALLRGDPRHREARQVVERARRGDLQACVTASILTARRIHDARHAAAALIAGVGTVYTYDLADWSAFAPDGLRSAAPSSPA